MSPESRHRGGLLPGWQIHVVVPCKYLLGGDTPNLLSYIINHITLIPCSYYHYYYYRQSALLFDRLQIHIYCVLNRDNVENNNDEFNKIKFSWTGWGVTVRQQHRLRTLHRPSGVWGSGRHWRWGLRVQCKSCRQILSIYSLSIPATRILWSFHWLTDILQSVMGYPLNARCRALVA